MFRLNCRRLARSSSFFFVPPAVPQSPPGHGRAECCPWGSGLCRRQRVLLGFPRKALGARSGEKQGEAGCCQQVPLFPHLLRFKVTHSLASWGTSFEVSFPSLLEAGFRPCPCLSYVIPWITVFIDNITPGTQRGKVKTTWMLYI